MIASNGGVMAIVNSCSCVGVLVNSKNANMAAYFDNGAVFLSLNKTQIEADILIVGEQITNSRADAGEIAVDFI